MQCRLPPPPFHQRTNATALRRASNRDIHRVTNLAMHDVVNPLIDAFIISTTFCAV